MSNITSTISIRVNDDGFAAKLQADAEAARRLGVSAIRALAEVLTQGACTSVGDVHERALDMADRMPNGVAASVRAMLSEAPAASGVRH